MYCTECGAIIPDGVKFCSSCGSRISTSEETTTSEQEQIQVQISELRGVLATAQEGNDNTRSIKEIIQYIPLIKDKEKKLIVILLHTLGEEPRFVGIIY